LLIYIKKERKGEQWKITEVYRAVAVDILSYAGVVVTELEPAELQNGG
jgi:hypothetical protein